LTRGKAQQVTVTEVVVGVDGSPESEEALSWSLAEGRRRDVPVRAITVWQPSGEPREIERLSALPSVADLREQLRDDVTATVQKVVDRDGAADVAVTAEVRYGHPVRQLISEAAADALLVVGSRGRGSIAGSLLGSVSQSCVQYARGTVVVVRGGRPDPGSRRVVVGVDGSPASVRALRFADEAARLRGAALQVVHAWMLPYLGFAGRAGALDEEAGAEIAARAGERLRESLRLAAVDATRPDVEMWLVEGAANLSLLQAASNAELLVVGSRGVGGWKGLLLGSVSTQCVTQSPCPVAVIRDDSSPGAGSPP
jgi:nucleotide-binding universal stress UspA family protein